jgi:hypothetical protein
MDEMYQAAAEMFAERLEVIFTDEKTMEDIYQSIYGKSLPFDRTDHWAHIFEVLLNEAWVAKGPAVKSNPTGMDRLQIIRRLADLIDYNLFSQVLLNLQGYTGMWYMTGDAQKEIARLKNDWPKQYKLNPFAPKQKMIKAAVNDEQKQFNEMLSTLRALNIITQFTPQISFRVSPKGSTPAFADSRNISMIGMGGDKYLKTLTHLKTFYIMWDVVPAMAYYKPPDAAPIAPGQMPDAAFGTFMAESIPYPFVSKSGGAVLQEVLFARKVMTEVFKGCDITKETCIMVPRMNSILVVTNAEENLKKTFEHLKEKYAMLTLTEGPRA